MADGRFLKEYVNGYAKGDVSGDSLLNKEDHGFITWKATKSPRRCVVATAQPLYATVSLCGDLFHLPW
jgi:hypothetical protein